MEPFRATLCPSIYNMHKLILVTLTIVGTLASGCAGLYLGNIIGISVYGPITDSISHSRVEIVEDSFMYIFALIGMFVTIIASKKILKH